MCVHHVWRLNRSLRFSTMMLKSRSLASSSASLLPKQHQRSLRATSCVIPSIARGPLAPCAGPAAGLSPLERRTRSSVECEASAQKNCLTLSNQAVIKVANRNFQISRAV